MPIPPLVGKLEPPKENYDALPTGTALLPSLDVERVSARLIESHYENNYGGALNRLNAISEEIERINAMLEDVQRRHPKNVRLFLPEDYLCNQTCPVKDGDLSLYWDDGHFTVAGARFIGARADSALRDFLSLFARRYPDG